MVLPQGLAFFALSVPEVSEVSRGLKLLARIDCKRCPKIFLIEKVVLSPLLEKAY